MVQQPWRVALARTPPSSYVATKYGWIYIKQTQNLAFGGLPTEKALQEVQNQPSPARDHAQRWWERLRETLGVAWWS
jgi:hypothetical protein